MSEKDDVWLQAVVMTSNYFYLKEKKYGKFPVTPDMIKLQTDLTYARLKAIEKLRGNK